jgi:hypothetical protein
VAKYQLRCQHAPARPVLSEGKKRSLAKHRSRIARDLRKLDEPAFEGTFNLCYNDTWYALSLKDRWGVSAGVLRQWLRGEL